MYHATKFGIEGFYGAGAQEIAKYNIGVTIVEPGGARTEFRYGSARVANLMPEYDHVHGFLNMLNPENGLALGDPSLMAKRIIESVDITPAPMRMVLGVRHSKLRSQDLKSALPITKRKPSLLQARILSNSLFKEHCYTFVLFIDTIIDTKRSFRSVIDYLGSY